MSTTEKIIFVMLTLLVIRIIMILGSVLNTSIVELFKNESDGNHLKRYINNISPQVYFYKTNTVAHSKKEFESVYLSLLDDIPNHKNTELQLYNVAISNAFLNVNLENIAKTPTKYVMSKNNLEKNMPYTINDKIVLNEKLIDKISPHIDPYMLETLIHEKLHTIQRMHQKKFNEFYKNRYPFLYKIIPLEKLPDTLRDRHMTNPDNNFDLWLYTINSKIYIPLLEITESGLREYAYEYNNINNRVLLKDILDYSQTSQTHPNELFAYSVASQLINGRLEDEVYNFLRKLTF